MQVGNSKERFKFLLTRIDGQYQNVLKNLFVVFDPQGEISETT